MSLFIPFSICATYLTLSVAQLGERCVRIAEVEGSIPFESTNLRKITAEIGGDFSFDHRNTTDGFPV